MNVIIVLHSKPQAADWVATSILSARRRANTRQPKQWYSGRLTVTYVPPEQDAQEFPLRVEYKGYDTSLQILRINGITHPTVSDQKVKDLKAAISDAVNYHLP